MNEDAERGVEAACFPRGLSPITEAELSRRLQPSCATVLEPGTHTDWSDPKPWDHLRQQLELTCSAWVT